MIHRAVVIACTKAKLAEPAPASRLYTGHVWTEWRKHMAPNLPCGWSLWALSAQHGLVRSWEQIAPYDTRLASKEQARLLGAIVEPQWRAFVEGRSWRRWPNHRDEEDDTTFEVVVIGGELYQEAARFARLPVVGRIDGEGDDTRGGIGVLRQRVRSWAQQVRSAMNATPEAERAWPPRLGSEAAEEAEVAA